MAVFIVVCFKNRETEPESYAYHHYAPALEKKQEKVSEGFQVVIIDYTFE